MDQFRTFHFNVTGFDMEAKYTQENIDQIFLPLLRTLTQMRRESGKRIVCFLAAPPATGKSTLALFLQHLSEQDETLEKAAAIGLDGFHYHGDYLKSHYGVRDGQKVLLATVKGAPDTYDLTKLADKLTALHQEETVRWPVYDRNIHDVREDAALVDAGIILFEGNYLLLQDPAWKALRPLADYSVLIRADESMLHTRLVDRKERGGTPRDKAEAWYESVDRPNILTVLDTSDPGDLNLCLEPNGIYRSV